MDWVKIGLNRREIILLDLANGSVQSGSSSGSTHLGSGQTGSGQKRVCPKWVSKPMTRTLSFNGRVKTRLTHIFTHEQKYICKWKETWSYRPKFIIEFLSKNKIIIELSLSSLVPFNTHITWEIEKK